MSITHQCFICGKILYSMQQMPGKVMCNECTEKEEKKIKEAEEKPAWDEIIEESSIDQSQSLIAAECYKIKKFLLQKNKEYGDSAIRPKRIFSTSDNVEQINVRIDDKLSRLMNSELKVISEDTELDLIGYLILRRAVKAYNTQQAEAKQ